MMMTLEEVKKLAEDKTYDHSLIVQAGAIQKPWFLAGGMQPDNVQKALPLLHHSVLTAAAVWRRMAGKIRLRSGRS